MTILSYPWLIPWLYVLHVPRWMALILTHNSNNSTDIDFLDFLSQ